MVSRWLASRKNLGLRGYLCCPHKWVKMARIDRWAHEQHHGQLIHVDPPKPSETDPPTPSQRRAVSGCWTSAFLFPLVATRAGAVCWIWTWPECRDLTRYHRFHKQKTDLETSRSFDGLLLQDLEDMKMIFLRSFPPGNRFWQGIFQWLSCWEWTMVESLWNLAGRIPPQRKKSSGNQT